MPEPQAVLCTLPLQPNHQEQVRRAFGGADVLFASSEDGPAIRRALEKVDVAVIASDLDERFIAAPALKWVHCGHSGLTKSARPEVFDKGLLVSGSAGRSAAALAQHGFYFALALTFGARALFQAQDSHAWRADPNYGERLALAGKTLGIVGFGHTGREMAVLGRAFQMRVMAYNRSPQPHHPAVDSMLCAQNGDTLDQLLDEADVIMLATQLTNETYHMFGAQQFACMRDSAFIINMARGAVINEVALLDALRAGQIAGAGLDVFEQEPLPPESPLWDEPNVVITSHQTPVLPDRAQRVVDTLIENIGRYRRNEPLMNALSRSDMFTPKP
jgi:phosphoglycerate dehydrogenase-like enzyme